MMAEASKKAAHSSGDNRKWMKVGAAALVGGAVIALTAGLAAPAIGAGIAAVGFGARSLIT